jgi:D-alanyl-D-alanine dipeptidase
MNCSRRRWRPRHREKPDNCETPDLVDLTTLDPTIKLDIRYATTNNFLSTIFYSLPRAFMQRPAAEAVVRAHRKLKKLGYEAEWWHFDFMDWQQYPIMNQPFDRIIAQRGTK